MLIKNAQAQTLVRDAIVLDLSDLARQGEQIVRVAKERAAKIIADAEAERKRLIAGAVEQGHQQGYDKGVVEGRVKGETEGQSAALRSRAVEIERIEKSWGEALANFEALRNGILSDASRDTLKLAVRLAERVTRRVVEIDPGVAVAQIEGVLSLVLRPTSVVVDVHPDDRALIEEALPELLRRFSTARHVELRDDARLSRGSCVARLRDPRKDDAGMDSQSGRDGGEIDASIDTQLRRIIEAILPDEHDAVDAGGDVDAGEVGGT